MANKEMHKVIKDVAKELDVPIYVVEEIVRCFNDNLKWYMKNEPGRTVKIMYIGRILAKKKYDYYDKVFSNDKYRKFKERKNNLNKEADDLLNEL